METTVAPSARRLRWSSVDANASGRVEWQAHAIGLEARTPGHDMRPALEQCPTLTLRHTAPDPELDPVVQRLSKALGSHRAAHADLLGDLLGGAPDEQGVGLSLAADSVLSPPADPR